ncbi:unnamed protein product [Cunninghamella echinulata]
MPQYVKDRLSEEPRVKGRTHWLFVDENYDFIYDNNFECYAVWDERSCQDETIMLVRPSDNSSFRSILNEAWSVCSGVTFGNKPFEIYMSSLFNDVFTGETVVAYGLITCEEYERWKRIQNL